MKVPKSSMLATSVIGLVALVALAVPAVGQEPTPDNLGVEQRPAVILAEAHELLGHDGNSFVLATLVARTANQAARYCELQGRYEQALEAKYTHRFASLFRSATREVALVPDTFGKAAFNTAEQYAWERNLMSVSLSAGDSEFPELGRACEEARNAVR